MSTEKKHPRKPVIFALDDEPAPTKAAEQPSRQPQHFDEDLFTIDETEDPFLIGDDPIDDKDIRLDIPKPKKRFSFMKFVMGALSVLVSLALGLWTDQLITDLFTRADWLGYLAITAVAVLVLALLAVIIRELIGLGSLRNIQRLKNQCTAAAKSTKPDDGKRAAKAMIAHIQHRPETARGRAAVHAIIDDIIDNPGMIALTETELMTPLDHEAKHLIAGSAKRVSVVTAVSPRAFVDIGYVLLEAARLVRNLAELYGGRPGFIGLLGLLRDVAAHLAVTGTIALGDSIIQQLLGHGLASKLSARLGEGVINGMMTARIGIAAMDLCRPMEFSAQKRPGVTDFLNVLSPTAKKTEN